MDHSSTPRSGIRGLADGRACPPQTLSSVVRCRILLLVERDVGLNATIALRRPTVKFLPALILVSALVVLNLLCAWYLSRRSFREFSVQFVAERDKERHSRMMQKAAQKRMQDEIRSTKS